MLPIIFAALCVAVTAAESSSVSSHSTVPSNMREYEYPSTSYLTSKPNYNDLSTASYISSGSSPYAKSDSRLYSAADSNSDSNNNNEPRTSPGLSGSYYKSKYGSDAVINALRPSAFHTGSSSSPSASSPSSSSQSSSSSSASLSDIQSNHYPGNNNEYTSSHLSSSSNDYPSSSSSFTAGNYGQREHHHAYSQANVQQPEYVGTRPTGTIYGTYAGAEYPQSRPTAYTQHSGLSGPSSDYSHHPHTLGHYPSAEDYPSPAAAAPPPHYKTYIMSGAPSYPTSKYSTVLGAIKSLFGGGSGGPMLSDSGSSATHMSSYSPMGPSSSAYYSPGLMHAATHHMPVSASSPSGHGAAPPSYYLGSGLVPSTSAYSKSYAPMRLMSGYNGAPGSKVIVVRDSGSAHLGASYQPTAGLLMASSTSYPVKSKISFGPSSAGPTYLASPSSLQSYTNGPSSNSFPASYSSSSNFAGGHGGSPFLGYSI